MTVTLCTGIFVQVWTGKNPQGGKPKADCVILLMEEFTKEILSTITVLISLLSLLYKMPLNLL